MMFDVFRGVARLTRRPTVLIAAGVLMTTGAVCAAATYRWTDDQGAVHYGDVVPPQYEDRARRMGPPSTAPTDAEQQRALERAARDRAQAAAKANAPPPDASPPGPSADDTGKRPAQTPSADTDCETWQRLYEESIDCFGPYHTVNGIRPEAFDHCNEVLAPPSRCRQYIR